MNKPKLIRTRDVAERYGRSMRTVERWIESGDLPKPTIIRGYKYWSPEELDAFDAARKDAWQSLGDVADGVVAKLEKARTEKS